MADNLPNDNAMVMVITFITKDYVEDESVIAEVVEEYTENVSGVTTRTFTNRGFSPNISHGTNFDVKGNDDSLKYSSTDNYEFVKVTTKKRKVDNLTIYAVEKKALNRKLNSLVVKNEKLSTTKKTADFSLKEANKR